MSSEDNDVDESNVCIAIISPETKTKVTEMTFMRRYRTPFPILIGASITRISVLKKLDVYGFIKIVRL